jgi:hypothetical protein
MALKVEGVQVTTVFSSSSSNPKSTPGGSCSIACPHIAWQTGRGAEQDSKLRSEKQLKVEWQLYWS